jgi:hypothetical protein
VYTPPVGRGAARRSALRHIVATFFEGSAGNAAAALLGGEATPVSREELERISLLIEEARKKGNS